ncbi:hypothetical protein J3U68_07015 [Snodgrassella sp. B3882]|nr:hypothetical protein [Snodgrassella sp. B3882]MCX8745155.1 hypothetical protein [Snodgrassella sp. B3882]
MLFVETNWLYDLSTPQAKTNRQHVTSDANKKQFVLRVGVNTNISQA